MKKKLFIFTQDYPFGKIETFLETEIKFASQHFDKVIVVSLGKEKKQNRRVPDNVEVVKLDKGYHTLLCTIYAILKLFSKETFKENSNAILRKKYSIKKRLLSWIKCYAIYKRIEIYLRTQVDKEDKNVVLYSYWLAEAAYAISKFKSKGYSAYTLSRCHGYEIRDSELYIPFRNTTTSGLDNIEYISSYTMQEHNRILKDVGATEMCLQSISRLGISMIGESFVKKNDDTFHIVSCSNVIDLKRLDLLIDALSILKIPSKCVWVHFGNGEKFNYIKELAGLKLSKNSNIEICFKGHVSNKEVLRYYNKNYVDVFVNCSDIEGVPVSMMEAMLNRIPCIARDVGGNSDLVINNQTGILLENNPTPILLCKALEKMYQLTKDKEKINQLRNNAYQHSISNFNAEKNYNKFYYKLLSQLEN